VAGIAGLREVGGDVVRIGGALIVLQMAVHASRAVQRVVVIDVTVGTLARRHGVQARQGKSGGGVVELSIAPLHRVVALLAGSGECGVRYRGGRVVVILLVATDASGGGDAVVVVDVTVAALARRHVVRSGQRKSGFGMIERRRLPGRSVVAGVARLRESARDVTGVGRVLEIFQVARDAGGSGQVVVIVRVAIAALARRHGVRTSQCEVHHGMIELRRRPCDGAVTLHAVGGEVGGDVIGVRRALEIGHMATGASRRRQNKVVVDVAVVALARRDRMPVRQRESHRRMIEFGVQPVIHAVATVAGRREHTGHVVRSRGLLKVRGVARVTLRGHGGELTVGRAFVAGVAVNRGVGTDQRKAVGVLLDILNRDLPSADGMALFAVRSELALMNVGMAILTALPHIREDRLYVALRACD